MLEWLKSTRSVAVVLVVCGLIAGLFVGKISSSDFMTIASIIITAYFAKRDGAEDQGGEITRTLTEKTVPKVEK